MSEIFKQVYHHNVFFCFMLLEIMYLPIFYSFSGNFAILFVSNSLQWSVTDKIKSSLEYCSMKICDICFHIEDVSGVFFDWVRLRSNTPYTQPEHCCAHTLKTIAGIGCPKWQLHFMWVDINSFLVDRTYLIFWSDRTFPHAWVQTT